METDKLPPGYYKDEDGIIYLTVDPYDQTIEETSKDIIKASFIRDCFARGEFNKIKPMVPDDCWEPLIKEYNKYVERRKLIKERFEALKRVRESDTSKRLRERVAARRNNRLGLQQSPQVKPPRGMQKCATLNELHKH